MIVITGGSGYVGSHITRRLAEQGMQVRAVVRSLATAKKERRLEGLSIDIVEGDITRMESLERALDGATVVVHTVAIAIEKTPGAYEKINFEGTRNVVDAARKTGVNRLIYLSQLGASAALPYRFLASKGRGEDYVTASQLDWTVFQPAVVWGPEDEFANSFARLIPLTPFIFPIVGGKDSLFQPVWIEDVVTCIEKALSEPGAIRKIYELGGPEILSLEEIERRTLKALGRRRWMIPFPISVLRIFVALMEAVMPNPPVTRSLLELLAVSNVTKNNSIGEFITSPKPFTSENIASYMREFRIGMSLAQFFTR